MKEYVQALSLDMCDNESKIEDLRKEINFREAAKADQMREYRSSLAILRMHDNAAKESEKQTQEVNN